MALRNHRTYEVTQFLFDQEDLVDDSTGIIPMAGLKTPLNLMNRFLSRLSGVIGAKASLGGDGSQRSVDVYLSRSTGGSQIRLERDDELQKLLRSMERSMAVIAANGNGRKCEEAEGELKEALVDYTFDDMEHIVECIQRKFIDNHETFAAFFTRSIGVNETMESRSELDHQLGDSIIAFHPRVRAYNKSPQQLHDLVFRASTMTRTISHLKDRLRFLFQNGRFANELYHLICTLGSPGRALGTFVRVAKTSRAFAKLTFHTHPVEASPRRVRFASPEPKATVPMPILPPRNGTTITTTRPSSAPPENPSQAPTHTVAVPQKSKDLLACIRPYLAEEDKTLGFAQLRPAAKQDTVQLIAAVLDGNTLPRASNAFHAFGFITTHDEEEERRLGGLYAALLKEARNPQSIFQELLRAIETSTLVNLFDVKKYSHFRQLFPRLETFLNTPPAKRLTVWRLKQFINDEKNTVPPPCLQRDYGFKFCRPRAEVKKLKDYYSQILAKVEPHELHNACMHGCLYMLAMLKGINVDPQDKRLMNSDWPVGYDNDEGLAAFRVPFYRRKL